MTQGSLPRLIESLLLPSAYPHPVKQVDLIQTHISYVLFAGEYVYKVKKPVNFGFLDYSTLEKRRLYCQEEVRLNRRLCPDTYLGVEPIAASGDRVIIGGGGEAVEYAVKMRRLPQQRMMDVLLDEGAVSSEMLTRLTGKLVEFHRTSERSGYIDSFGSEETIRFNWRENFDQTGPYVGRTISRERWQAIRDWVESFLGRERRLLERRVREGRIRDCHGDLRTNAVCFVDGVCVFDCIEFNERFRYSDVASDVAFLAMDMDFKGNRALSDEMVGLYLAQSRDTTLPLVLNFYKCYRAFVRGKVDGFQIDEPEIPASQREEAAAAAGRYFDLAAEYCGRSCPPLLMMMVGATGSGKSYLAHAFAGRLGAAVISSDVIRKELAGIDPSLPRIEPVGSGIYSPESTARTYDEMLRRARAFLEHGHPVILDATYLRREQREGPRRMAEDMGVPFLAIECLLPEALVHERLRQRETQPWSPSDGRWEIYEAQRSRAEPPSELGDKARLTVDTSLPLSRQLDMAEERAAELCSKR
ncbi:MAG: AAA family ATPase [Dehalococcoidia bacterium]|nr:AAA family ATPase [Dehalococcoidia bacterium]